MIPQCRIYPAAGLETLQRFAKGGGHLLFLGDRCWTIHCGSKMSAG